HVTVQVYRKHSGKKIRYDITRGMVPIKSVESTQMVTDEIGYIKLARFAETTPAEFELAAKKLLNNGMTKLILDLRDNGGGYLHAAVELADHFLSNGRMIVYTEGRYNGRTDYYASHRGRLENVQVAILINANTASASEIVSGAIQDNDKGIVLGRRSYGKGLVQEPIQLTDGSAIRLTVARYYTPSGRCIQKPYGEGIDYAADYADRYENGEFYKLDSSKLADLEQFKTVKGRTVYGGGGIFPDVFIPLDTIGASSYLTHLAYTSSFTEFAFEFVDRNRKQLGNYRNARDFDTHYSISESMYQEFVEFAEKQHKVVADPYGIVASADRIKTRLKAQIAQNLWEENGWFTVFIKKDQEVKKAIEEMEKL
ncbi:MAG: peptidase S41, partial [Flavobacteriales bacterium]|nr:peptidase S41 [Flavobacteriales bacterium]